MRTRLLPIRYRLPLFVCTLVLTVGVVASIAAYFAVRHSAMDSASSGFAPFRPDSIELLTGIGAAVGGAPGLHRRETRIRGRARERLAGGRHAPRRCSTAWPTCRRPSSRRKCGTRAPGA